MHLPATSAKVLYQKIELDCEFTWRDVNVAGREKFVAFLPYTFSLFPTSTQTVLEMWNVVRVMRHPSQMLRELVWGMMVCVRREPRNRDHLWEKLLTGSRFCPPEKTRLNLGMPFEEKTDEISSSRPLSLAAILSFTSGTVSRQPYGELAEAAELQREPRPTMLNWTFPGKEIIEREYPYKCSARPTLWAQPAKAIQPLVMPMGI